MQNIITTQTAGMVEAMKKINNKDDQMVVTRGIGKPPILTSGELKYAERVTKLKNRSFNRGMQEFLTLTIRVF